MLVRLLEAGEDVRGSGGGWGTKRAKTIPLETIIPGLIKCVPYVPSKRKKKKNNRFFVFLYCYVECLLLFFIFVLCSSGHFVCLVSPSWA